MIVDLVALGLKAHHVSDEIVTGVRLRLGDELLTVVPVLDEVDGVGDLVLVAEVSPRHCRAAARPLLDLGDHVDRNAEQGEDRDGGNIPRERRDDVCGRALREHPVDQAVDVLADQRLEHLVATRRECLGCDIPDARVLGGYASGQSGICREAALGHDALGRFASWSHGSLGVLGGELLPVGESRLDVVVAGHNVVADAFVEHHRLLATEFGIDREWVRHGERLEPVVLVHRYVNAHHVPP